ncbi:MAG: FCD domain-containing protein [Actinobacteria bacterium]|nr:FCD domain-containing protein [Actinomycetota bacterium]
MLEIVTRPVFTVLATRFHRDDAPAAFWRQVERDHVTVADAVAEGDARAAGEQMRAHLLRLRATYERIDRATRAGAA